VTRNLFLHNAFFNGTKHSQGASEKTPQSSCSAMLPQLRWFDSAMMQPEAARLHQIKG